MTALEDRRFMIGWIDEAHAAGARLAPTCMLLGIDVRTLQRWRGALAIGIAGRTLTALCRRMR